MPKLDFDGDIMRQYNDKGILVYEGGYAEYEGETVGVGVAVCKSGKGKEYFDDGALKYEGDFKNGKYDGFGISYKNYSKTGGKDYRKLYEGGWKNGKQHGKGITYISGINSYDKPDGSHVRKFYEGDCVNGYFDGKGKIFGNYNTLAYEGDVKLFDGKHNGPFDICNGYGKKYYLDIETLEYEGEFKRGKFDGQGKLYTHPEAVLNDKGVYVNKTGEEGKLQYEGTFKNGKLNGYGKEYYTFDGSVRFEGERKDGERKDGKRYNPSGITYDGEFNDGEKHGHGKWIRDGVLYYDGDFFEGEIQGKGKLYDGNGVLAYEGDFFEARREGHGKYYEDGKLVYEGERKDGIPLTPREGYDQEKEDKRYEDDLCGRFWGMGTALLEHRKGTIGLG